MPVERPRVAHRPCRSGRERQQQRDRGDEVEQPPLHELGSPRRITLQITGEHKPRPLAGVPGASPVHLVVMRASPPISSDVLARPSEASASSKCTVVFSVTLPTEPIRQPPASGNPRLDDSLAPSTVGTPLRFRSLSKPSGVYNSSIRSLMGRKKNITGS